MTAPIRLALVGRTISYSKSPDIFRAVFDACGVVGSFELVDVEESDLESSIRSLRQGGYAGFSVTIPYKECVAPLLDECSRTVQIVGAVNCVAIGSSGRLTGHNTDCYGFGLALLGVRDMIGGGHAAIIGYGGAARAAAFSLVTTFGTNQITVVGRDESRMADFARWLQKTAPSVTVGTAALDSFKGSASGDVAILVNCTPMGGFNSPDQIPVGARFDWRQVGVYYDLNYNHDNRALAAARDANVIAIDGRMMLIGQAVRAFEIWTGLAVSAESIRARVF